jgi:hypothetical protein
VGKMNGKPMDSEFTIECLSEQAAMIAVLARMLKKVIIEIETLQSKQ